MSTDTFNSEAKQGMLPLQIIHLHLLSKNGPLAVDTEKLASDDVGVLAFTIPKSCADRIETKPPATVAESGNVVVHYVPYSLRYIYYASLETAGYWGASEQVESAVQRMMKANQTGVDSVISVPYKPGDAIADLARNDTYVAGLMEAIGSPALWAARGSPQPPGAE